MFCGSKGSPSTEKNMEKDNLNRLMSKQHLTKIKKKKENGTKAPEVN